MTASPLKLIYVAGPFRAKPNPQDQWVQWQNIMNAAALSLEVWKLGAVAVCPHLNTAFFEGSCPAETWLQGDLAILDRCDGVLMTPNWHYSEGARGERDFAVSRRIPVFFSLPELQRWLKDPRVFEDYVEETHVDLDLVDDRDAYIPFD